ncbi:MAG: DEAD/DEAH box helicase [Myxococcota bacterium]|nr:DEAD/DEAH box helicase [Myxococcota bacterium]
MSENPDISSVLFEGLALPRPLLDAIAARGYETPTPIQAQTIPALLEGRDVLGQAQTGTGKTAAFALPMLARLDLSKKSLQALVLAPTRELALQVCEACEAYGSALGRLRVLPIYGGQDYGMQLKGLARGPHIVVGTPGRVIDLAQRGALPLGELLTVVIDEADEMLRMGFIDDVEWILSQTPQNRQMALFSATMPPAIRRIASRYLKNPVEVRFEQRTKAAVSIRQRGWLVDRRGKLEALCRILEGEKHDGVLVFVRTKVATEELAAQLQARDLKAAALNGDLPQSQRERTVEGLRDGRLDVLVATDVAARGLDVERISHVINFDAPSDVETYVHRIGRTGRAGRSGEAILFVFEKERHVVRIIERTTGQKVTPMTLPSAEAVNRQRIDTFHTRITGALASDDLEVFRELVQSYAEQSELEPLEIAAALAKLVRGDEPLLLPKDPEVKPRRSVRESERPARKQPRERPAASTSPESGMERYRLAVGQSHGVRTSNIVGAIANEAGISSQFIGRIHIYDDFSTVDLPQGLPKHLLRTLQRTMVCQQPLALRRLEESSPRSPERRAS